MTSELRPAKEVVRGIYGNPVNIGASIIEADREAVRAEQAAELAKFKALADTLAGALGEIAPHVNWLPHPHCLTVERLIREALRKYKEASDAS